VIETQVCNPLGPLSDVNFTVALEPEVIETDIEVSEWCAVSSTDVLRNTNYEAAGPGQSNPLPAIQLTLNELGIAQQRLVPLG